MSRGILGAGARAGVADAGPADGRAERSTDTPWAQAAQRHTQRVPAGRRLIARRVAAASAGGACGLVWSPDPRESASRSFAESASRHS